MVDTFADLLCGGGGFALGAIEAGLVPTWSVESDADIANLYEQNIGNHVIRSQVQDVDYSKLPQVYHLHMSPICTNASQAKAGSCETENDLSIADACVRAIKKNRPVNVSLENVYPYRNFESFKRICRALTECGYNFKYWNLNAADYGVPQTRKRLILLASRERHVQKPEPTHINPEKLTQGQGTLFAGQRTAWLGWYEAIKSLIPELPASEFAAWQLKRLPAEMANLLVDSAGFVDGEGRLPVMRAGNEPSATIISNYRHRKLKAFLIGGGNTNKEIVDSKARFQDSPSFTVASGNGLRNTKAFIVDCQEAGSVKLDGLRGLTVRKESEPVFSVTATQNHRVARAWLSQGRVVAMTVRALARFQSFPDSYQFSGKASLDCRVIGNAVPPLLAKHMV